MAAKVVLVTGANGYIGNATARAFVRDGWTTYGLVRSLESSTALTAEEIHPIVGSIDDIHSHQGIRQALPSTPDVIVSTTENTLDFVPHFNNILTLLSVLSAPKGTNDKHLPLVIYTAGSKDYGVGPHLANDPALKPIDEESALRPPRFAALRVQHAPRILDQSDLFDAVLVRPTNVYGRASSYYSICFRTGERIAAAAEDPAQRELVAPARPEWISHALHIDDCANAYVSIASAPRERVRGEVFNISSEGYESAADIVEAIAAEYNIAGGIRYVDLDEVSSSEASSLAMVVGFPQLISSEKLRKATGWRTVRKPFSEDFHTYRLAYEASKKMRDENVAKIGNTIKELMSTVENP
jgi:nucleoside-diphosphate-sugar epimerase